MYINISELGTDYTVTDNEGKILRTIQVIPQNEILDAALGPYTEDFGTFENYLKKSVESITGYDNIDPNTVLWWSTHEEEVVLTEIIQYAVQFGYDKIILEQLEDDF